MTSAPQPSVAPHRSAHIERAASCIPVLRRLIHLMRESEGKSAGKLTSSVGRRRERTPLERRTLGSARRVAVLAARYACRAPPERLTGSRTALVLMFATLPNKKLHFAAATSAPGCAPSTGSRCRAAKIQGKRKPASSHALQGLGGVAMTRARMSIVAL